VTRPASGAAREPALDKADLKATLAEIWSIAADAALPESP
jgi:hypothetical protein